MTGLPDNNGNDFIRGLETRACVNGMTKSDVERLKNALVKKILDDETVIDVTEDGSIVADSNGMFISVNGQLLGLSVDGEDVIPVTEPYLPEDENENPLAPPNDTIMTSANIAVDPRIVHTIGNETINGNKTFINGIDSYFTNWHLTSTTGMSIGDYAIFAELTVLNNYGRFIVLDFIQSSNTLPCLGRFMFQCSADTESISPKPVWIYRKSWGNTNNPLSNTAIVMLRKDGHVYLAWHKEYQYGAVRCRVVQDINYGSVTSMNYIPINFYNVNDVVVINSLDGYTVYQVVE